MRARGTVRWPAVLAVLLLVGTWVPSAAASWQVSVAHVATVATAASWAQPLYSWGQGGSGRSGVLLQSGSTSTAVRAVGPERWTSVSTAKDHTCAVTDAGALYCWGYNFYKQLGTGNSSSYDEPILIASGTTWSMVAASAQNTCGIRTNGTLWCWGQGSDGAIGDGSTTDRNVPTAVTVSGVTTWKHVTVGYHYGCGIKTDDTLWCWGDNSQGQIGNGAMGTDALVPVQVSSLGTVTAVSAAEYGPCAIRASDSSLWCWGDGTDGQNGNGSTAKQASPVSAGAGTWKAVSGGNGERCGLRTDGTLWCWGDAFRGALGTGDTTDQSVPTQANTAVSDFTSLTSTEDGGCALRASGAMYCWGRNGSGELGIGNTTDQNSPVLSGSITDWTLIDAGSDNVCGLRAADQGLWCQGSNGNRKLGHYDSNRAGAPTPVSGPETAWVTGTIGDGVGCGIRQQGTLWCWGNDSSGSAGQGTNGTTVPWPAQVGVATDWVDVSADENTVCGLRGTAMYCWGSNTHYQYGNGTTTDVRSPGAGAAGSWAQVSVGYDHTCAISTAGVLSCWGYNSKGQVGDGSTSTRTTPVALSVAGVGTWQYVSAGNKSTCAIAATGTLAGRLFCWGDNGEGQLGIGSTTDQSAPVVVGSSTVTSVEVGNTNVCAVRSDGTLWCSGLNFYGHLSGVAASPWRYTSPTQLGSATTWTDVAVGYAAICGVRTDHSLWCWGYNNYGQVGNRDNSNVLTMQQVPNVTVNWVDGHGILYNFIAGW